MTTMNNFDSALVSARLKSLRLQKGITQNDIADALDVSAAYISNVENAKTRLNLRVLLYYAQLLEVSVDYLLDAQTGTDPLDYQILGLLHNYSPEQKQAIYHFIRDFK